MNETKHTPGPWIVGSNGIKICSPEGTRKHFCVAIANQDPGGNIQEDLANARLIAAAPELLAALDRMVNEEFGDMLHMAGCVDVPSGHCCACSMARAAIAKAKGTAHAAS